MTVDLDKRTKQCSRDGNPCAYEGTAICNTCSIYAGIRPGRTNKYKQE